LNRHITILERLLAGQEERMARTKAEMESNQEKMMVKMKASHDSKAGSQDRSQDRLS
jgi:hypothetical protein